ncbi:zinc finger CCCH domain-containing protein 11B-like [Uranotaenia lowii]|uniref:zinc finger CCCH domain-containing protein 11B-like n=1 Tax=Uranotaenia lowii TaxID=190385 RepID=UPI002479A821|nr:zinc finger CCCH domain-containing protein 11B-like [Uranotaenia lowii]
MELLPRNLHDCYFFYYSTCKKGSACEYRHEAAALGHEETCKKWAEGICFNRTCTMRHMKIEKPRSATPCFWEDQPGGCRKPHCVFQHKVPKPVVPPHPGAANSLAMAAAAAAASAAGQVPQGASGSAPTATAATTAAATHLLHTPSPAVVLDYNYAALLPRII